jgi:hypothetical protein
MSGINNVVSVQFQLATRGFYLLLQSPSFGVPAGSGSFVQLHRCGASSRPLKVARAHPRTTPVVSPGCGGIHRRAASPRTECDEVRRPIGLANARPRAWLTPATEGSAPAQAHYTRAMQREQLAKPRTGHRATDRPLPSCTRIPTSARGL